MKASSASRRIQRAYRTALCRKLEAQEFCTSDAASVARRLGIAKMRLGRFAEGKQKLLEALSLGEHDPTGILNRHLANCAYREYCDESALKANIKTLEVAIAALSTAIRKGQWMVDRHVFVELAKMKVSSSSYDEALGILLRNIETFMQLKRKSTNVVTALRAAAFLSAQVMKRENMLQEAANYLFKFVDTPPRGLSTDAILFQLSVLYAKMHVASPSNKRLLGMFHEAQYAAFQCCPQESAGLHLVCRSWFKDPMTHVYYAKLYLAEEHYILAQGSLQDALNLGWKMNPRWRRILSMCAYRSGDRETADRVAHSLHIDHHIERLHTQRAYNTKVNVFVQWREHVRLFARVRAFVASRGILPAFNAWKSFVNARQNASVVIQCFSRRVLATQVVQALRKKRSDADTLRLRVLKRIKVGRISKSFSAWQSYAGRARYVREKYSRSIVMQKRACFTAWKERAVRIRVLKRAAVPIIQRAWRGWRDRRLVEMLTVRRREYMKRVAILQREHDAARRIQSFMRYVIEKTIPENPD